MMSRVKPKFCLRSYDAIGFDMDGVVAKYNFLGFKTRIYNLLVKHLVEHKGHSPELFPEFDKVKHICSKGIVIDSWRGNLLKCGAQGTVFRACHGTKVMSRQEIAEHYINSHFADYKEIAGNLGLRGQYAYIESLYEAPIPAVFALLVNDIDAKRVQWQQGGQAQQEKYVEAMTNVWQALRHIYSPAPVWPTDDPETFFEHGTEHPEEFVVPCSAEIQHWIRTLRSEHRPVFILTSSYGKFTNAILRYVLGPNFEECFDFFMCQAGKPNFFRPSCTFPFVKLDPTNFTPLPYEVKELENGCWYKGGNNLLLNRYLQKLTGKREMKILYIGDGMKNDIWPAKHFGHMDTLYILENMVSEGMVGERDDHNKSKPVTASDVDCLNSPLWGSILSEDGKEETLLSSLIRSYTDVATPLLDYITDLPEDEELPMFDRDDPSVTGYYPAIPKTVSAQMNTKTQ